MKVIPMNTNIIISEVYVISLWYIYKGLDEEY